MELIPRPVAWKQCHGSAPKIFPVPHKDDHNAGHSTDATEVLTGLLGIQTPGFLISGWGKEVNKEREREVKKDKTVGIWGGGETRRKKGIGNSEEEGEKGVSKGEWKEGEEERRS